MRYLALFFVLTFFTSSLVLGNQKPEQVRFAYLEGTKSKEKAQEFENIIAKSESLDPSIKLAYMGAAKVLNARYIKLTARKKVIDEGTDMIERAVEKNPNNTEIRLIRLSIQENLPKILNYNKNINEDKEKVLEALNSSSDANLKKMIQGYLDLKSK